MSDRKTIGRDTTLCMSLAARPGTFGSRFQNHLYEALGLDWVYKAFTTTNLAGAVAGIRALGIRAAVASLWRIRASWPPLNGGLDCLRA